MCFWMQEVDFCYGPDLSVRKQVKSGPFRFLRQIQGDLEDRNQRKRLEVRPNLNPFPVVNLLL